MNEFFTTMQKEARTLKLSPSEKQAMRMHVYKVMDASPALGATQKVAAASARPEGRIQPKLTPIPSMYVWFSPRFMVPLAVLLLVGLSGGTAFAAQSALPGDPLYAIKVNVTEPVQTALATTPQAKAQVNAAIATTRLEEAESLASSGKLNATTTAELSSNFAAHADAAQTITATLATQDPGTAAQLGTTFSSTLAAHGAILVQLATDASTSSVQVNSDALAVQVLAQAVQGRSDDASQPATQDGGHTDGTITIDINTPATNESTSTPDANPSAKIVTSSAVAPQAVSVTIDASSSAVGVSVDATAPMQTPTAPPSQSANSNGGSNTKYAKAPSAAARTSTNTADDGVIALALQTQASSTLAQTQNDFSAIQVSLDASTTLQIQAQISAAQDLMGQGSTLLSSGKNATAKEAFGRVLRMSVKLDAFLKAGKKFNVSFLTSLLNN